jgi:hypothetical protein
VIDVAIGEASQTLLFDTGSVGISVLSTSVSPSIAQLTGPSFQEPFDDGVVLSGVVVSAPVTVSGQPTAGPISLRLVQSASCGSQTPDCPARDGMSSFARSIDADGIFGAGLWATDSVFNPLLQLDSGQPGTVAITWGGERGSVALNGSVSSSPIATVQMPAASPASLPNGLAAWSNDNVSLCWQMAEARQTCIPTVLDTGASAMSFPLDFPGGPTTNVKELPAGQTISAAGATGEPPFLSFVTGRELGVDLVTVIPGQSTVDSGIQFFRQFVVVFSLADGTVELFNPQ